MMVDISNLLFNLDELQYFCSIANFENSQFTPESMVRGFFAEKKRTPKQASRCSRIEF